MISPSPLTAPLHHHFHRLLGQPLLYLNIRRSSELFETAQPNQAKPNPVQFFLPPSSPSQWTLALPLSSLGLQRSISRRSREEPQSMKSSREQPRIVYHLKKERSISNLDMVRREPDTIRVYGPKDSMPTAITVPRKTEALPSMRRRSSGFLTQSLVRVHPHSNHQLPFVQLTNRYA